MQTSTLNRNGCVLTPLRGQQPNHADLMESNDLLRPQFIQSLLARPAEPVAQASVDLWAQLSAQIISIIGEGGFNSLYTRTVDLTLSSYPWLAASGPLPQRGARFSDLKTSLQAQPPAQASAANAQLLITFTDILASLIGEQLTIRILQTAWGQNGQDKTGKEFIHE